MTAHDSPQQKPEVSEKSRSTRTTCKQPGSHSAESMSNTELAKDLSGLEEKPGGIAAYEAALKRIQQLEASECHAVRVNELIDPGRQSILTSEKETATKYPSGARSSGSDWPRRRLTGKRPEFETRILRRDTLRL